MNTPIRLPRGNQRGLTLIEILVAMSISLLLLAGVIQIFASSKAAYRINEAQSRLQENGRFALQMITADIRMAGFWGCLGNNQVFDHLNNPPGGSVDPVPGGIIGIEGGTGTPLPADSITVQGVVGGGLPVNAHAGNTITTIANGLVQDDLILVGDCTRADLLQITNANPNLGAVTFDIGAGTPGNASVPNPYGTNAILYRAGSVAYTIADGNSGQPGLFRSENGAAPMELVEGVENLQILYGEDTNNDEAANFYGAADAVNMDRVVSVRVNLTLRSLADNIVADAGPVDRRLRRTFSSTIVLRNRVP